MAVISYSTNFAATENPISEAGAWIDGGTTGLDWGNVATIPGLAYGTSLTTQYADPTAVLTGTWASDQEAQATVEINGSVSGGPHEVELRLRTTIAPHSITGYEIIYSVDPNNPYIQIVRWNGALNDFTYLNTTAMSAADGDVLKATAIGSTITVYKNGTQVLQATDSTFSTGSPGIGFYDSVDTNWTNFGFSSFSASNIGSGGSATGTPIETAGATDLTKVGNNYYFYAHGTTTGPTVKYSGAAVVAGQFGAWAPIAAEAIAGGYEVAWKYGSADQYAVWKTDSSGNYVLNLIPAVSGTDPNLEAIEPSFQQDLNRDGVIGTNFPPSADDGAPVETLVTAINVGGQQFTAANGITYLADPGPTQGAAASNTFWTSADIVSTNDDPLYNTERWTPGGSYTYEIPVANGTYRVELNFAEIFGGITGAGQRVFDMSLENQPLPSLQNIDIYGQVGANAPLVIDQLITVTDGSLSIQVGPGSDSPGNVQNAKLNAFSVFNEGGASTSIGFSSVTATSLSGGSDTTPSPSTAGETATSAPKTITVTDPPAATLTSANAPLKTSSGSNRSATADNHLAPNIDRAVWLSELKPYDLPSAIALDWASELRPSTIGGLDPSDIAFVSRTTHNSYGADGNSTGGGLTESDSMLAANIALLSQYMAAAFVKSMDGFDGTLIHDAASVTKMEMLALPQHG